MCDSICIIFQNCSFIAKLIYNRDRGQISGYLRAGCGVGGGLTLKRHRELLGVMKMFYILTAVVVVIQRYLSKCFRIYT